MNSRKDTSCPGMWIELKGSDDCFATSIYTIDSYGSDLKEVFTAAVKYQNQLPGESTIPGFPGGSGHPSR